MSDFSSRNIKLYPPNTIVFRYFNKHDVLVTNMVSKLIKGFKITSYEHSSLKSGKLKADIIVVNRSKKVKDKIHCPDDDFLMN